MLAGLEQKKDKGFISVITQDEIIEVICILAVRLERLEKLLLASFDVYVEQNEFLTKEVLKTEMERLRQQNKDAVSKRYMSYRLTEIDNSLKGFITFYHTDIEKRLTGKDGDLT